MAATVVELRASLLALGMDSDEVAKMSKKELREELDRRTPIPFENDIEELNSLEVEDDIEINKRVPNYGSVEWNDYVLSLFTEDELVEQEGIKQKCPTVDGLRRVGQLVLGRIIQSKTTVIKAPSNEDRFATVVVSLSFIVSNTGLQLTFEGSADCNPQNADTTFLRHATATAETRAEGRALRKALCLRKVVAAEEVVSKEVEDLPTGWASDEKISAAQIKVINKLCKVNDLNVLSFMNSGKQRYSDFNEISKGGALAMIEFLNEITGKRKNPPSGCEGYCEDWQLNQSTSS